jgi:hypothetical protein
MNDEGKILPEKSSLIRIKNAEERKLVNDYIQSKYPQESGIIVKD